MRARRYEAHPQSAAGDFYVVNGQCISCGAPHAVAPDLIGWAENGGDFSHCIWKRQPLTADEVQSAIAAVLASEVGCHRYAGDDPQVIERIGSDYCDAPGRLRPVSVNRKPPSPPRFALVEAGRAPLGRTLAALRSMASWFLAKVKGR